jgi:hypothetical protein
VLLRNGLFTSLPALAGAVWLPKNVLVLRPDPTPGSPNAVAWDLRAREVMDNRGLVRWFEFGGYVSPETSALFVSDAMEYQNILKRRAPPSASTGQGQQGAECLCDSPQAVCTPPCAFAWCRRLWCACLCACVRVRGLFFGLGVCVPVSTFPLLHLTVRFRLPHLFFCA